MRISVFACVVAATLVLAGARPSLAQRVAFERSYTVGTTPTLDVSTIRGKIDVSVGEANRIVVRGTATVRWGLSSPNAAYELAKRVAADPPIQQEGAVVRLRPPAGAEEQRAMTVAYDVLVPPGTIVRTNSDSGETTVSGALGSVSIRTQSAAIRIRDLGGEADVTTGSGQVDADSVAGNLSVSTDSSRINARNLGAGLHVRTQSGAVEGTFRDNGNGNVDIGTGSSAIELIGVNGGLTATSNSGRIRVTGAPSAPWQVTSGSGSFELDFDSTARMTLEARSGSGTVYVNGSSLQGSASKSLASGTVGGGGPLVRATSRSGSIRIGLR
jgi:putative adhesin